MDANQSIKIYTPGGIQADEEKRDRRYQVWQDFADEDGTIKNTDYLIQCMIVSGANLTPDQETAIREKEGDETDFDTFCTLMDELGDQDEALIEAFARFDHDGNGRINRDELKAILQELGEDGDIEELFEGADLDKNGWLSNKELVNLMNRFIY